jgi:hypothetical protein
MAMHQIIYFFAGVPSASRLISMTETNLIRRWRHTARVAQEMPLYLKTKFSRLWIQQQFLLSTLHCHGYRWWRFDVAGITDDYDGIPAMLLHQISADEFDLVLPIAQPAW